VKRRPWAHCEAPNREFAKENREKNILKGEVINAKKARQDDLDNTEKDHSIGVIDQRMLTVFKILWGNSISERQNRKKVFQTLAARLFGRGMKVEQEENRKCRSLQITLRKYRTTTRKRYLRMVQGNLGGGKKKPTASVEEGGRSGDPN